MCGIAGIIDDSKVGHLDPETVPAMLRELERRGPDDEGTHSWGNVELGHRRLSIFDLTEAGHQPMISKSGRTGIVFNGAIYNFRELKEMLSSEGVGFSSRTDTEVLLKGFEKWGIDKLVSRIEGMFAFAIWDDRAQRLFLVRDRLGVKPLVFASTNGRFAFASTVRALRQSGCCGEISTDGLVEYLEFGFITDSNSIFKGVKKLEPATILEFSGGKVTTRKYWKLDHNHDSSIGFEEAVEETERLFLKAVEKRLFADVPVGALLSGGIDSSLVCWAVSELGGDVTAFTVGVPGDEWDETEAAATTAKSLGIDHRILEISGATPFDIGVLANAYAEPFACASALGLIDISKEVRKHATVLLTGDGGDDVFLGYPEHLHFLMAQTFARATPELIGEGIRLLSKQLPSSGRIKRAKSWLSYAYGGLGGVTRARDGMPVYEREGLLGETLQGAKFPDRDIPLKQGDDLLAEFLEYDLETRFTGEYLPKVDGGTMHHALEARSPFLDTDLWEFADSLPFKTRLHERKLKAVLRELVRKNIGPELAAGAKKGFGVPVQRWLTNEWNGKFREAMRDSRVEALGFVNTVAVLNLLSKSEVNGWAPRQLWFVLVLEEWLRKEQL
ncbi:MAG: asparagine synthase (glutamine-hydrolyzing) [Pyrinomonadaceae bacterium]|nr:asparagine synthase (glutamine-hydrolyzing) [Pyrinomonadaceae bacterium]